MQDEPGAAAATGNRLQQTDNFGAQPRIDQDLEAIQGVRQQGELLGMGGRRHARAHGGRVTWGTGCAEPIEAPPATIVRATTTRASASTWSGIGTHGV